MRARCGIVLGLLLTVLAACGPRPEAKSPRHVSTPEVRADSLLLNFWKDSDFGSDSLGLEQRFADFAAILPYGTETGRARAVDTLVGKSGALRERILGLAERYLYDPESPTYSEEMLLPFLGHYSSEDRGRAQWLLECILKNAPGTPAANFGYVSADGTRNSLFVAGSRARIILMFFEPGCGVCKAAVEYIEASENVRQEVEKGRLRLVAVSLEPFRPEDVREFSDLWSVGYDADGSIDADELYIIRATPTLYDLSPTGTVIRKDFPVEEL